MNWLKEGHYNMRLCLQVYGLADVSRHGYDLHSVLELPLYEALLGGSVLVKTVRGHRHIMVPAGERKWLQSVHPSLI